MKMASKTGGKKYDDAKTRYDLLPTHAIEQVANVFTYGANKYAPRNWEIGYEYSRLYAAAHRHLAAFWMRDNNDDESGLPHLAHAACCVLMLLHHELNKRQDIDDRP